MIVASNALTPATVAPPGGFNTSDWRCGMRGRAFAIVDLATLVVLGFVGGAGLLAAGVAAQPEGGAGEDPRARAARLAPADMNNVRAIGQAMVVWANNNQDSYPLPSRLDKARFTVAEKGASADTTANIYSILVFAGSIKPEALISPLENNPRIEAKADYAFKDPPAAVSPARALWDPSFSADFTDPARKGNASYAHLMPFGARAERWSNTFAADEIQLGTRGPEIAGATYSDAEDLAMAQPANTGSNTLSFFGPADAAGSKPVGERWAGHLAFADNHVEYREVPIDDGALVAGEQWPMYRVAEDRKRRDVWCFDEPGDGKRANTYLGIFTTAGAQAGQWRAIWD